MRAALFRSALVAAGLLTAGRIRTAVGDVNFTPQTCVRAPHDQPCPHFPDDQTEFSAVFEYRLINTAAQHLFDHHAWQAFVAVNWPIASDGTPAEVLTSAPDAPDTLRAAGMSVSPVSGLANPETASSSLGAVSGNEMPVMLSWLRQQRPWIEGRLARRHLRGGTLVLHEVTSSYLEGRCCPPAAFGHNRVGKKGKEQIAFGSLRSETGCLIAVEEFPGNTGDPATVASQVRKRRSRFGIERIALVGDRGMPTTARIRASVAPADLDWISALKSTELRKLLKPVGKQGPASLKPDQLLPDAVAENARPDLPGERLLVCLNPRLREERARKREDLLLVTEAILEEIARVVRQPQSKLRGRDRINRRVGREANRRKVEKHFQISVSDDNLTWARNGDSIAAEAPPDGIYIVRTSLPAETILAHDAVFAYKSFAQFERAFQNCKSTRPEAPPVYVYSADHVRAHVLLCALAC